MGMQGLQVMCCGPEAGSYLRLIDSCITQLKAQGPSRTCNESKEEEEEEEELPRGPSGGHAGPSGNRYRLPAKGNLVPVVVLSISLMKGLATPGLFALRD